MLSESANLMSQGETEEIEDEDDLGNSMMSTDIHDQGNCVLEFRVRIKLHQILNNQKNFKPQRTLCPTDLIWRLFEF